jgi:hypothetical protein
MWARLLRRFAWQITGATGDPLGSQVLIHALVHELGAVDLAHLARD